MKQLTKRQEAILNIIQGEGSVQNRGILKYLKLQFDDVSRVTLIRDLNDLVRYRVVKKQGRGRSIWYQASLHPFLRTVNSNEYFKVETDQRIILKNRVDFSNASQWEAIIHQRELEHLNLLTEEYRHRLMSYKKHQIQKELERITIEFSWKSSRIEGNTYSLLDTEQLIKMNEQAEGHPEQEATMILNHKAAFEYIWKYSAYFKKLTRRKIEEIHTLIVKNLAVSTGLRKRPVRIIGTTYQPYDNQYQIREALDALMYLINKIKNPFLKALIATVGLSYLQPFEDGNKRTSRVLGNALLLAYKCCPLSYRGIDEVGYKKAIILFYEQHTLVPFKKLFMEQYEFAVKNYFL